MKFELWLNGKTSSSWVKEGLALYEKRLTHYISFQIYVLPEVKNAKSLPPDQLKQKEADIALTRLNSDDYLLLLDEKGKHLGSVEFAKFLEHKMQLNYKRIIFLVGGAWGFHSSLFSRADYQLSLSSMTYSHQMVRIFLAEQLYRAMTIIRGEPYHNE